MQDTHIKGIPNIGNTCFLNTCLQILLQTPELDLLEISDENDRIEKFIWFEWKQWKNLQENPAQGMIAPSAFFSMVQKVAERKGSPLFSGFNQNDLSEFLLFFMDALHEYFKRPRIMNIQGKVENPTDQMAVQCYKMIQENYHNAYSDIMELFYGIQISNIHANTNPTTLLSSKPESFFLLDLPIISKQGQVSTIYTCLDNYVSPEYMENGWICEKTKETQSVYKSLSFWNFPKILVVSFQRFQTNYQASEILITKKMDPIDFPIEGLDLSKYVVGYFPKKYQYDVYGIVNHIGDVHGGHYTGFVKKGTRWYHCNDDRIEIVPNEHLSVMVTSMAYMLFYRRR